MVHRGVEPRFIQSEWIVLADILIDLSCGIMDAFLWKVGFEPTPLSRIRPQRIGLDHFPTPTWNIPDTFIIYKTKLCCNILYSYIHLKTSSIQYIEYHGFRNKNCFWMDIRKTSLFRQFRFNFITPPSRRPSRTILSIKSNHTIAK